MLEKRDIQRYTLLTMTVSSNPYRDGFLRALPIVLGYLPVGFAFGVLAVKNNIPPIAAIAMSILHFAGSGQFVFAGLWGAGASILSVMLTVLVVNLRHLLMSAALTPHIGIMKRWQRFFFGYELTDETFGVHITAFQQGWRACLPTLYVCNMTAHSAWISGTVLGVFCGEMISDVRPLGLDFALPAMFLALLVPQCRTRLHVVTGIAAVLLSTGIACCGAGKWNVIVATILAAALGAALESIRERR